MDNFYSLNHNAQRVLLVVSCLSSMFLLEQQIIKIAIKIRVINLEFIKLHLYLDQILGLIV
jgi:hypothetical protein